MSHEAQRLAAGAWGLSGTQGQGARFLLPGLSRSDCRTRTTPPARCWLGSGSAVQMWGCRLCMVLWGPAN